MVIVLVGYQTRENKRSTASRISTTPIVAECSEAHNLDICVTRRIYVYMISVTLRNTIITLVTYVCLSRMCTTWDTTDAPSISIYRGTMYTAECHKSLQECGLRGVCYLFVMLTQKRHKIWFVKLVCTYIHS